MMNPHFAEGRELAASGTAQVDLPDDDGLVMAQVCKVLHHKFSMPDDKKLDFIYEVAVVCDKYSMTAPFRSWSQVALLALDLSGYYHDENLVSRWIWIAYVFDDRSSFYAATSAFVLNTWDTDFPIEGRGIEEILAGAPGIVKDICGLSPAMRYENEADMN